MPIAIRLRTPTGQKRLEVDDASTLGELLNLIRAKTDMKNFSLKYGYPLQELNIQPDLHAVPVKDLGLRGETLVLASLDPPADAPKTPSAAPSPAEQFVPKRPDVDEAVVEWPDKGGYMVLRIMPDDNSCLFTAFGGAVGILNPSAPLRAQIASYILSHPDVYTSAILDNMTPRSYVSKLQVLDTWGGAIELGILSDLFDMEIASIDCKSLRVDKYGQNKSTRCILLYSGIHYDRIAFTFDLSLPPDVDVTKWSTAAADGGDEVLAKAIDLAKQLQARNYYTDTSDFVIQCEDCEWIGQGEKELKSHQRATGHQRFGQIHLD